MVGGYYLAFIYLLTYISPQLAFIGLLLFYFFGTRIIIINSIKLCTKH